MAKNSDWFRLYPEIRHDRKIRRLTLEERWLWIVVLCIAAESPSPGKLLINNCMPYEIDDIADQADMSADKVQEGLKTFAAYGLIRMRRQVLEVVNWRKRQYDRPSDCPKAIRGRKARSRARKKEAELNLIRYCAYCGEIADQTDHIIPVSKGGSEDESNLVDACKQCNGSKGSKDLANFLNDSRARLLLNDRMERVLRNEKLMRYVRFENGRFYQTET